VEAGSTLPQDCASRAVFVPRSQLGSFHSSCEPQGLQRQGLLCAEDHKAGRDG
jgi:hypothetical protein